MIGMSTDTPTPPDSHAPREGDPSVPMDSDSRGSDPSDIDHRRERISVETERHRIVGFLTLARDGYRSRISDVLNAPERDFLTLTEVTVEPLSGGPVELHPFLTVSRRHIVFAVAASDEVG